MRVELIDRDKFLSRINTQPSGCWHLTLAPGKQGYSVYRHKYDGQWVTHVGHKVSWLLAGNVVPDGLQLCHSCDNRRCVNPGHLWLGTQQENVSDMIAKNRMNHTRGVDHWYAKLTEATVSGIRSEFRNGRSRRELAEMFCTSYWNVKKIVSGRSWKHVP